MQELTQLIGLIAALVAITLKAIISSTHALSYSSSSSSLGGNPIFSLHSIWSGTPHPVSVSATAVPSVFTHVPIAALPKCVPVDHNSTLPGFTRYKYDDRAPTYTHICSQGDFVYTTYGALDISATAHKRHQKKVARRMIEFFEATLIAPKIISSAWSSKAARWLRKAVFRWAIASIAFLEYAAEPDFVDALKLIIDALARFARRRGYIASGHRSRKTTYKRCPLHPKYRYYSAPYFDINDLDGAYSLIEMPLVPHSFLGHGIMQLKWEETCLWYSADDLLPVCIEHTEVLFEIRLAHATAQRNADADSPESEPSAPPRGRGAQWTHHTRKCVAWRVVDDSWFCIVATRDEVYFTGNGYTEVVCALEKKYSCTVPEDI